MVLLGQFLGQPDPPPVFYDKLRQAMAGFQPVKPAYNTGSGARAPSHLPAALLSATYVLVPRDGQSGMCRRLHRSTTAPTRCSSGPCAYSVSRSATSRTLSPPAASKQYRRVQTCVQQSRVHGPPSQIAGHYALPQQAGPFPAAPSCHGLQEVSTP